MNDGTYRIDVTLSGGTGRASVGSPAELTVSDGEMTARIEWSSPYYDLMLVDGAEYLPVNTEGNSVFLVPVGDLDVPLAVKAETVAMSEPHLIEYELLFDAESRRPMEASGSAALPWGIGAALIAVVIAAAAATVLRRRKAAKKAS